MTRKLESVLGYGFDDYSLLEAALTHRSYRADEPETVDYERLEFLGDAVLQLAVTDKIYADYPSMPEGQMAKLRAAVVNEEVLASLARGLNLGSQMRLGKGEQATDGGDKDSLLSDVFEAVLGAIYLDSDFVTAAAVAVRLLDAAIAERADQPGGGDFKTRLQEVLAKRSLQPEYHVSGEGPDHDKVFHAEVEVAREVLGSGSGSSKKAAEQAAAEEALSKLAQV
ncbi:MAG: ribonuclease III [Acidimicrobiia bacterium]